jgi:hypothetical protein
VTAKHRGIRYSQGNIWRIKGCDLGGRSKKETQSSDWPQLEAFNGSLVQRIWKRSRDRMRSSILIL